MGALINIILGAPRMLGAIVADILPTAHISRLTIAASQQ